MMFLLFAMLMPVLPLFASDAGGATVREMPVLSTVLRSLGKIECAGLEWQVITVPERICLVSHGSETPSPQINLFGTWDSVSGLFSWPEMKTFAQRVYRAFAEKASNPAVKLLFVIFDFACKKEYCGIITAATGAEGVSRSHLHFFDGDAVLISATDSFYLLQQLGPYAGGNVVGWARAGYGLEDLLADPLGTAGPCAGRF